MYKIYTMTPFQCHSRFCASNWVRRIRGSFHCGYATRFKLDSVRTSDSLHQTSGRNRFLIHLHTQLFHTKNSMHWSRASSNSSFEHHSEFSSDLHKDQLPVVHKSKIPKEYLLYIALFSSLVLSYFYWSYATRKNSELLLKSMESFSAEIFQGALANGLQVLAHPQHLEKLQEAILGNISSKRKLKLQLCIIMNPEDEIRDTSDISPRIVGDAIRNTCIMNMEANYYIFPAVATVDEDKEKSNKEYLALKEVSRQRKFMNRIVHVHCYLPLSAEEAKDMTGEGEVKAVAEGATEANGKENQPIDQSQKSKNNSSASPTKIVALHVVLSHMGDKMSTTIDDFRITEVNLVNVNSLPWRNRWLKRGVTENGWLCKRFSKLNLEKTVTPGGNYQFVNGISMYQKTYDYNITHRLR